ncbi:MAG TPA: TonB family protein [Vicinamibacteria bacterium]|nr:TonB family protein [Vicinamibacteria bacterium]
MKLVRRAALLLFASFLAGAPLLAAQEPVPAGEGGVPIPKKTKHVQPVYPQQAIAQGLRGIVILDLVIDATGHVTSANVVRSVPGLDEAAIAAARQWQFEPVRMNGKAVSVRLTQAITFSLALPKLERETGVPELRQGVSPSIPKDFQGRATATAEVTLESDGRIAAARIVEGNEPWAGALLQALQTWRFTPPPDDASFSFRVAAELDPSRPADARIVLKAGGLQRSETLAAASSEAAPASSAPPAAASTPPATPKTPEAAPRTAPAGQPGTSQPGTSGGGEQPAPPPPAAPPQPGSGPDKAPPQSQPVSPAPVGPPQATPQGPTPATPALPAPGPARAPGAAPASTRTTPPPADRTAPPPTEVITAPPPQAPPENGVSAIRDVALEPGVPDLTRGHRPVAPPFARIAGASGSVEVQFSVNAAGATLVQSVAGPDLLKKAAEAAVVSWVFRRTRADRAYLTAVFNFSEDKATAVVRPQPLPAAAGGPPAGPVATTPSQPAVVSPPPPSTAPGAGTGTSPAPPTAAPPAAVPTGPQPTGPGAPGSPPAPERPSPTGPPPKP